jgi:hypothetical protein
MEIITFTKIPSYSSIHFQLYNPHLYLHKLLIKQVISYGSLNLFRFGKLCHRKAKMDIRLNLELVQKGGFWNGICIGLALLDKLRYVKDCFLFDLLIQSRLIPLLCWTGTIVQFRDRSMTQSSLGLVCLFLSLFHVYIYNIYKYLFIIFIYLN